jgi:mannose-6-phosphate isomerase-like protein (cupin superfamily)
VTVIRSSEAPRFELPGVEFTGLAAPSRGSTQLCTWQLRVAPRHTSDGSHHLDHDEVFMVTAGSVQVEPEGPVLRAGDAVVVPAGSPILLVNPDDEPAELFVAIRAGFSAVMADGTAIGTPPWAQ